MSSGSPDVSGQLRRCGVSLGSNLGDRGEYLAMARDRLLEVAAVGLDHLCSPVYETAPIDCEPGTPPFLNSVIEFATAQEPQDLLTMTKKIEQDMGRPGDHGFHTPRTVDLDLLYLDDVIVQTETLKLPHPGMTSRRFVLQPLNAIRPDLILPGQQAMVQQLLADLGEPGDDKVAEFDCPTWN